MAVVAEAVLGLVHVSLFLFWGAWQLLTKTNTTVGLSTVIP